MTNQTKTFDLIADKIVERITAKAHAATLARLPPMILLEVSKWGVADAMSACRELRTGTA